MITEFPLLPQLKGSVKIFSVKDSQTFDVHTFENIQGMLDRAVEILKIPTWRTQEIYQFHNPMIPNNNALFLHINETARQEAYLVYKDDDVYEMVYYDVNEEDVTMLLSLIQKL